MGRNEAPPLIVVKAVLDMRARCHISITIVPITGLVD